MSSSTLTELEERIRMNELILLEIYKEQIRAREIELKIVQDLVVFYTHRQRIIEDIIRDKINNKDSMGPVLLKYSTESEE